MKYKAVKFRPSIKCTIDHYRSLANHSTSHSCKALDAKANANEPGSNVTHSTSLPCLNKNIAAEVAATTANSAAAAAAAAATAAAAAAAAVAAASAAAAAASSTTLPAPVAMEQDARATQEQRKSSGKGGLPTLLLLRGDILTYLHPVALTPFSSNQFITKEKIELKINFFFFSIF